MEIRKLRAILGGTHLMFYGPGDLSRAMDEFERFSVEQVGFLTARDSKRPWNLETVLAIDLQPPQLERGSTFKKHFSKGLKQGITNETRKIPGKIYLFFFSSRRQGEGPTLLPISANPGTWPYHRCNGTCATALKSPSSPSGSC